MWWWLVRISLEVVTSCFALAVLNKGAKLEWRNTWWIWIVAGATGPAIARMKIVSLGRGEHERAFGLAHFYEPVRDHVEDQIDDIGATEEARWLHEEVLPTLVEAGATPDDVGRQFQEWIRLRTNMSETTRLREIEYVDEVLGDARSEDAQRIEALVTRACSVGAHRMVESLLTSAQTGRLERARRLLRNRPRRRSVRP